MNGSLSRRSSLNSVPIEDLPHFLGKSFGPKGFLEEFDVVIEYAVVHNGVVGVARHIEKPGIRTQDTKQSA